MKIYRLLYLPVMVFFAIGCANNSQDAVSYNNAIIEMQSEITNSLNRLDSAVYSSDSALMGRELDEYLSSVARAETNVNLLGPYESDSMLLRATLQLIEEFKFLGKGYDSVIRIMQVPDNQLDTAMQRQAFEYKRQIFTGYADAHRAFLSAQLEFAVKNKFVLTQNETKNH